MTDRSTISHGVPKSCPSPDRRGAADHFAAVAHQYRSLRLTDSAPVQDIAGQLRAYRLMIEPRRLIGIDVGAGTGRYSEALNHALGYMGDVVAVDRSLAMLTQGGRCSVDLPLPAVCSDSSALPVRAQSLDFVASFNAIHHFNLPRFTEAVKRVVRPGGHLFVYTRTPEQNSRSIWGRNFPGFTDREQRLYCDATLREAFAPLGPMVLRDYAFQRSATLAQLTERVRGGSYSTFALYSQAELDSALARFLGTLAGTPRATWTDENLLIQVTVGG